MKKVIRSIAAGLVLSLCVAGAQAVPIELNFDFELASPVLVPVLNALVEDISGTVVADPTLLGDPGVAECSLDIAGCEITQGDFKISDSIGVVGLLSIVLDDPLNPFGQFDGYASGNGSIEASALMRFFYQVNGAGCGAPGELCNGGGFFDLNWDLLNDGPTADDLPLLDIAWGVGANAPLTSILLLGREVCGGGEDCGSLRVSGGFVAVPSSLFLLAVGLASLGLRRKPR